MLDQIQVQKHHGSNGIEKLREHDKKRHMNWRDIGLKNDSSGVHRHKSFRAWEHAKKMTNAPKICFDQAT
jgi:hypothetical protein